MNKKIIVLLATSLMFFGTSVFAGDPEAGKTKSATCAACHGAEGSSSNDIWPNLKGQKNGYLVKQIQSFPEWGSY